MYRKDILEKHKITVPTTYEEFLAAAKQITEAEKANGVYGTGLQAKSGPLLAGMRLEPGGVGPWRLDLQQEQEILGQR